MCSKKRKVAMPLRPPFYFDNGSEFPNHRLPRRCTAHPYEVGFTRSRPQTKNDEARVEQKNGSDTRHLSGCDRHIIRAGLMPLRLQADRSREGPGRRRSRPSVRGLLTQA